MRRCSFLLIKEFEAEVLHWLGAGCCRPISGAGCSISRPTGEVMQFLKSLDKKAKRRNDPKWHTLPGNLLSRLFAGKEGTAREGPRQVASVQEESCWFVVGGGKKASCEQRSKSSPELFNSKPNIHFPYLPILTIRNIKHAHVQTAEKDMMPQQLILFSAALDFPVTPRK